MSFTIKKMLSLQPFNNARIAAGSGGLQNQVLGITILERNDVDQPSMEGDVVVTSVYFVTLLFDRGIDYITECRNRQAAGIVIKEGSNAEFFLPDSVIAEANRMNFPVIIIQNQVNLSSVISGIMYEVFRQEGFDNRLSFEENYFQELVAMSQDRETLLQRGAMLGLRRDEVLCALIIQPSRNVSDQIVEYCRNDWHQKCYALTKNNRVMVALCLTVTSVRRENLFQITEELVSNLKQVFPDTRFHVGIGRCYKEIPDFQKSFYDATCALSFSLLTKSDNMISHFSDLGVYRILFDYKNRQELYRLYQDTVGLIADYDEKNQTEYLQTIRIYFSENYSINNTAKKIHVHYNTVLNRLNKIKQLFGIDLNDEQDRINLYVSIIAADSQDLWEMYQAKNGSPV